MASRATQLKSLRNNLSTCSKNLQNQVKKRGLINKTKKIISSIELRKLAKNAGLGAQAEAEHGTVLAPSP